MNKILAYTTAKELVGRTVRVFSAFESFAKRPKLEFEEYAAGPFVAPCDDLLIVDAYDATPHEAIYAERRWFRFCLLNTAQTGWLPVATIDEVIT